MKSHLCWRCWKPPPPTKVKGVILLYLSLQLCNYIKFVPINRNSIHIHLLKVVLHLSHCERGHWLRPEVQLGTLPSKQRKKYQVLVQSVNILIRLQHNDCDKRFRGLPILLQLIYAPCYWTVCMTIITQSSPVVCMVDIKERDDS